MKNPRILAAAAIPMALLALAGCSTTLKADPADMAAKAEDALQQQVGTRPNIDCGTAKIELELGKVITCALTADGLQGTYDVTMTITQLDSDGKYKFDIKVADQPRP